MEATTKNRQSYETLVKMIKIAFGEDTEVDQDHIREMEGGFCNIVYLVQLNKVREVVLKIAPADEIEMMSYEVGLLKTEVEVLRIVEEKTAIAAPKVLFYDDTRKVCNAPYFFMSKIEGQCFYDIQDSMTEQQKYEVRKGLGNYIKQMNVIKGSYFSIYGNDSTRYDSNKDFILKLFSMMLADGIKKKSDLKYITYEDMWNLVVSYSDIFDEVKTPVLVHWDLWEGNVFIRDGKLSGIIDFERAMWGDFLMEHEFSSFQPPAIGFVEGYGLGELTRNESIRCSVYKIYRILAMIIECDYRHYEDDGQYNWVIGELEKELIYLKSI